MADFINPQFLTGFVSAFALIAFVKVSKFKLFKSLAKSNPYLRNN